MKVHILAQMGACKLKAGMMSKLKATRYEDAKKLLFEGYYKQMQSARKITGKLLDIRNT